MTFRNVVCWQPELASSVMDTEATQTREWFFLATHNPIRMRRVAGAGVLGTLMTQEELRHELLDKTHNHMHVVIQGTAGSGKSHLVRWLKMTIPEEADRRVILIPKVGTNLKSIIELVLKGMEGPSFDDYRARLNRATANLTPALAREELLNKIAISVGPNGPNAGQKLSNALDQEEREDLIENLPALLYDKAFRQFLVVDGGIVAQLAEHILGESGRERRETRRKFTMESLPLMVNQAALGRDAQAVYSQMKADPEYRQVVVDWINQNLDWAVMRVLDFSGDDLGQLMMDVRSALAEQGKELILLIEDFAKFEGTDFQLLEALLVRPNQGERQLCVLRSAIAVTTGYYESASDTVQARTDLVVNMDLAGTGQNRVVTRDDLARFAARYLNVMRLHESALQTWYAEAQNEIETASHTVPNACEACEHKAACHHAFGSAGGAGLYPFTAKALDRMFTIYTTEVERRSGAFNPRDLLNHIVKHTLTLHYQDIAEGRFPSAALLARFGRRQMPALRADQLHSQVPAAQFEQYQALYELWGNPDQLDGLSDAIFQAFGLAALAGTNAPQTDSPSVGLQTPTPEPNPPRPSVLPSLLEARLRELNSWANGGVLTQPTSQYLRERLYEALDAFIDWDAEMLVRSFYSGKNQKAFQITSINFKNQATGAGRRQVQLLLPIGDDFTTTSIALRGLLLYEHYKHWNFEDGGRCLRAYAEILHVLARQTVTQLRRLPTEPENWNPVPAIVELLSTGARLFGSLPTSNAGVEERINALFLPWNTLALPHDSPRTTPWKQLVRVFADKGDMLVSILKSRTACTKGGRMAAQIVDAAELLEPIEKTRAGTGGVYPVPETVRSDYQDILRVRRKVDELLEEAITAERQRRLDWLANIRQSIGRETSMLETAQVLEAAFQAASAAGLLPTNLDASRFMRIITDFKRSAFETVVEEVETLSQEQDRSRMLARLGRSDFDGSMTAVDDLVEAAQKFLSGSERRVSQALEDLTEDGVDVRDTQRRLREELDGLCEMTTSLMDGASDAV